jgi:hypothetical protein
LYDGIKVGFLEFADNEILENFFVHMKQVGSCLPGITKGSNPARRFKIAL